MIKNNPLILYHATTAINIYVTIQYIMKFLKKPKNYLKMFKYTLHLQVLKKRRTVKQDHGRVMTIESQMKMVMNALSEDAITIP